MRKGRILMTVVIWLSLLPLIMLIVIISGGGIPQDDVQTDANPAETVVEMLTNKVLQLETEIIRLRKENIQLRTEADNKDRSPTPSIQHERLRRRVENVVRELRYYVTSRMEMSVANLTQVPDDVNGVTSGTGTGIKHTLDGIRAYTRTALADLRSISDLDSDWRQEESKALGRIVQDKIHKIMNPKNCEEQKKFFCDLRKSCGFGCQIHHLAYCLLVAVYHGRPLVLISKSWTYSRGGWEEVFKPISDTCRNVSGTFRRGWKGNQTERDAWLPVAEKRILDDHTYLPLAVPEELAPRLVRFHENPGVWWIGQLMAYIWRPQPPTSNYIDSITNSTGFKRPIVGIQVRRTDKLKYEANAHGIEQYMAYVEQYYNERELTETIDKRRVFIATDDTEVVTRARHLYPHYEILNDAEISRSAGMSSRYTVRALLGVVTDIHLLASTDFLVCTFSSNVCRAAYELLQTKHGDASQYFRSLDDVYYFGGQRKHYVRAVQRHVPQGPEEIDVMVDDKIHIYGNHWDGYSKGQHKINRKIGLFPSYKVEDTIPMSSYPYKFLPPGG